MTDPYTVELDSPFREAVELTRSALQDQGFGILTEADLHNAFATKLSAAAAEELGDYLILGACNPPLAQRALAVQPEVGLLLPCNVIVHRAPSAGRTTIQAVRPTEILPSSVSPVIAEVAEDAARRLIAAIGSLDRSGRQES